MKVFSVIGLSKTGKTTTIEKIIKELKKRNYSVGSVKEIHFEDFAIDTPGTNTHRHMKAGSEIVTARGLKETDILFPSRLPVNKILKFYDQDYVVMEGVRKFNAPKIFCTDSEEGLKEMNDSSIFCISGKISNELNKYNGIPIINSTTDISGLVDLIIEKVYEMLPDFPPECCDACGFNCRELGERILAGKSKREDCVIDTLDTRLTINNNRVKMVPFVQNILRDAIIGIVKNLKGYENKGSIEVKIEKNR